MINSSAYLDVQLQGNNFLPSGLKRDTKLPLEIIAETGKIGTKGRYKGKPSPYGLALLSVDLAKYKNNVSDALFATLNLLSSHKSSLKKNYADNILIDVEATSDVYKDLIINTETLKQLSNLKAKIKFHQVERENNKEMEDVFELTFKYCAQLLKLKPKVAQTLNKQIMEVLLSDQTKFKVQEDLLQSIIILYMAKFLNTKNGNYPSFKEDLNKSLNLIQKVS